MIRILTTALAILLCGTGQASAADGHQHGQAVDVGEARIGALAVDVAMSGAVAPGKEVHLELHLAPATPAPRAIRVWIGNESGRGSEKAKAAGVAAHPGGYEAHVEVPAPLPEGSRVWISIEPVEGEAAKGSLALPAADAKPTGHQHDHQQ